MGLYARHVLPKLIDAACAQKPMSELRYWPSKPVDLAVYAG